MKKLLFICLILSSCASVKRYSYESTHLNEGEISKYHVKATVVSSKPTMRGYANVFVTDKGDTLKTRYSNLPLEVNKCYYVWRTKAEKDL